MVETKGFFIRCLERFFKGNPDYLMTMYVSHSADFDFQNELYLPLRNSNLNNQYKIILPQEQNNTLFKSREYFQDQCDFMVVESSYPSPGVGIEVGWADAYEVPIIAIYKRGFGLPESIKVLSKKIIEYSNSDELVSDLEIVLKKML